MSIFPKTKALILASEQRVLLTTRYRDMGMSVLEKFRQLYYSDHELREHHMQWGIGFMAENDYGTPLFWNDIRVSLEVDHEGIPIGFVCHIHGRYEPEKRQPWLRKLFGRQAQPEEKFVRCGLSSRELVTTLADLQALLPFV